MGKRFTEEVTTNVTLRKYYEPEDFAKVDAEATRDGAQANLDLTDAEKQTAIDFGGTTFSSLAEYNAHYEEIRDKAKQLVHEYGMSTVTRNFTVLDGRWDSPLSVVSKCGEDATNVAANAVDDDTGTLWQHNPDEAHEIVLDHLGYVTRIEDIEIWIPASPGVAFQLTDVDVYVSRTVGNWKAPVATGLVFDTGNSWNVRATTPKNGRYVRVVINSTAHVSNQVRIREIKVRTIPQHQEES